MNYDPAKVDEAVLALLWLTAFREHKESAWRTWKGHDWEALDRLCAQGFIGDPQSRAKSVVLTQEGAARAEALAAKLFGPVGATTGNENGGR